MALLIFYFSLVKKYSIFVNKLKGPYFMYIPYTRCKLVIKIQIQNMKEKKSYHIKKQHHNSQYQAKYITTTQRRFIIVI